MKVISISNRKGGTGKTNIAYNLAVELSQKHSVLMIDMDPQMDLTYTSNLIMTTTVDILDVLYNQVTVEKAAVALKNNLDIIKGNENINQYEKDDETDDLKALLSEVKERFDYVIIDHPPTMIEASVQAIFATNIAIIVTQPERLAYKNIEAMMKDIKLINENIDVRILINKVDMRRNLTTKYLRHLQAEYSNILFTEYISISSAFPTSNDKRIPLRKLSWWPKVLTQLRKVMKEIV